MNSVLPRLKLSWLGRIFGIVLLVLSATGCTTYKPTDVTLLSVAAVDRYDQRVATYPPPIERFLEMQVSISTNASPAELLDGATVLSIDAYHCDRDRKVYRVLASGPFWNGRQIRTLTDISDLGTAAAKPVHFELYLKPFREPHSIGGVAYPGFDLRNEPVDICVEIVASRAPFPARNRSNTVRVPRDLVRAVLAGSPAAVRQ